MSKITGDDVPSNTFMSKSAVSVEVSSVDEFAIESRFVRTLWSFEKSINYVAGACASRLLSGSAVVKSSDAEVPC